jgi:hypothetical protein
MSPDGARQKISNALKAGDRTGEMPAIVCSCESFGYRFLDVGKR